MRSRPRPRAQPTKNEDASRQLAFGVRRLGVSDLELLRHIVSGAKQRPAAGRHGCRPIDRLAAAFRQADERRRTIGAAAARLFLFWLGLASSRTGSGGGRRSAGRRGRRRLYAQFRQQPGVQCRQGRPRRHSGRSLHHRFARTRHDNPLLGASDRQEGHAVRARRRIAGEQPSHGARRRRVSDRPHE